MGEISVVVLMTKLLSFSHLGRSHHRGMPPSKTDTVRIWIACGCKAKHKKTKRTVCLILVTPSRFLSCPILEMEASGHNVSASRDCQRELIRSSFEGSGRSATNKDARSHFLLTRTANPWPVSKNVSAPDPFVSRGYGLSWD